MRMREFRSLLTQEANNDPDLLYITRVSRALFDSIEAGEITPPRDGLYSNPFQGDGTKFGFPHPLYSAAAEFICALEDWPSKTWWTGPRDYGSQP